MSDLKLWAFPGPYWTVVQADAHGRATVWLNPGWYRREARDGVYKFTPITGWRYVAHRVLWGFDRLVDAR
ncbi:hypothetical protein SEA_TDANISKY_95 [Mycobacterium phage TDanisky]|uniref:Uncharacterized protein n=1 Tax=Mycobacterium phage Sparkdehlily TaxID=1739966 RepID=A0A0S1S1X8_9CAUD|nr:hypothetical protein SEA_SPARKDEHLILY_94 [Mycobacterium phage Sparkdehlily]ALM02243.1 hypothetical protein SEA_SPARKDEHLILY_94 [Mycobacterium phage Sparkdehlily]QGH71501.1 hypothetical protein SEA_TDANISKY_95 [Mycobacterium phage TDanisky]